METIFRVVGQKGLTSMPECSTTLTVGSLSCVNQRYLHTSEFISVHYSPLKITNKCRRFVFRTDLETFLVLFKVTSVICWGGVWLKPEAARTHGITCPLKASDTACS